MPWEGVKGLRLRVNYFKELFVFCLRKQNSASLSKDAAKVIIKSAFCW
jgi:hypothetical protein